MIGQLDVNMLSGTFTSSYEQKDAQACVLAEYAASPHHEAGFRQLQTAGVSPFVQGGEPLFDVAAFRLPAMAPKPLKADGHRLPRLRKLVSPLLPISPSRWHECRDWDFGRTSPNGGLWR